MEDTNETEDSLDRDDDRNDNDRKDNDRDDDFDSAINYEDSDVSSSESDFDEALSDRADDDTSDSEMFDFTSFGDSEDDELARKSDVELEENNADFFSRISGAIQNEVSRQAEDISSQWNDFTDKAKSTWDKVKEGANQVGDVFKEFTDAYPPTAAIKQGYSKVKEGVNYVKDKVAEGVDYVGDKIKENVVDPIKNFLDEKIGQPLDRLNERLGNNSTFNNELDDLYLNPYNTTGSINWHARANPNAWADDNFFNLGPARLDVMTNDMWNAMSEADQQHVIDYYGEPTLVNSLDEMKAWISDKNNGIIDGINPLMTRMDLGEALEKLAKAQGTTMANTFAMSPTDFNQYMSEPVFSIDSIPENATNEDILTAIEGEMARRSLLTGTAPWFSKEERGQAKQYQEKLEAEGGLTYDDLRALRDAIKQVNTEPGAFEKISGGIANFFMPGATTAAQNQDIARSSFDPRAVLQASRDNKIPVKELLKLRDDAITYNNPEKAIKYFEMTGDTLNNARVIEYVGSILKAMDDLQNGRITDTVANTRINQARADAVANKVSDIWNNDTMKAIKSGAKQIAIGMAAGAALKYGTNAAARLFVRRLGSGNATRLEQGIAKLIAGNKKVKNAARFDAMKEAFEAGNTAAFTEMDVADEIIQDMRAFGAPEAEIQELLKGGNEARIAQDLAQSLSDIANAENMPEWFSSMSLSLGYANPKDFAIAAAKMLGSDDNVKKAAAVGATAAGAINKAAAKAVPPKQQETIVKQAPTGLVEKINKVAEDIPATSPGTETATNEALPETEESFKTSEETKQIARDLAQELTPGEVSNPEVRKEMLENAERISGIDYTERARWLNDLITDKDIETIEKKLPDDFEDEEKSPLRELFSFAADLLGASVNPIGLILTFAKELPDLLNALGFEQETVNSLRVLHDQIASRDADFDANDYQQTENLGEWGYTGKSVENKGNTANASQVKSDANTKRYISHVIREEPYMRVFVKKYLKQS